MSSMRSEYKKLAENHVNSMEKYMGEIVDSVWEVVRICSRVIDRCLRVEDVVNNQELTSVLLIVRNSISDCCCCLDSLERGHERTVSNNLRMVLEDICAVANAKEDNKVLESLLTGNHQASSSIAFFKKKYPTHELQKLYGHLSKISHHQSKELIVRQWENRDGLMSHLKSFNPERIQDKLNSLLILTHIVRIAGEIGESLCFDHLDKAYFWADKLNRNENCPVDIIVIEIATKIEYLIRPKELSP